MNDSRNFKLLTYNESQGTYRAPHDHGRAWVLYVVLEGEVEMRSFINTKVVQREVLAAGDSRLYHAGEIHDTKCLSSSAKILRLTSADLKEEERLGYMKRYSFDDEDQR